MKSLVALAILPLLAACVVHVPARDERNGVPRRPLIVVCIFASCHVETEKPETPTPSPSTRKSERTPDLHASRLGHDARGKGIGSTYP